MSRPAGFESGIYAIDARQHDAEGVVRGAVVVAHPHPLHGGNMDHPVVIAVCERAAALGLTALRFDFRGVRDSEGTTSDFLGHLDDWRRAVEVLRERVPEEIVSAQVVVQKQPIRQEFPAIL